MWTNDLGEDGGATSRFPCILHWNQDHFVVLYDVKKKQDGKSVFYIADPGKNLLRIDEEEFRNAWISTRSRGRRKAY